MIRSSLPMCVAIAGDVTYFSRLLRRHQHQDDPILGRDHTEQTNRPSTLTN